MSLLQKASIITTPTAYAEDYLYSIKPAIPFGDELIVNGNFNTDSDWTLGTYSTISDNKVVISNSTGELSLSQDISVSQKTLKITYTISDYSSGVLRTQYGAVNGTNRSANGTYTDIITGSNTTTTINFFSLTSSTSLSISNVSVKEVTDADFDFDRNSTGTRVNEDYLIEDVPYNLLRESQSFGTYWSNTNSSESLDTNVLAPDGTATAWKLQPNAGTHFSFITQTLTMSGQVSFSVFMKKGTATTASMFLTESGNFGLTANLENGTITSITGSNMVGSVESAGNGWYRFEIKHTSGDDLSNSVRIGVEGGSLGSVTYDGTENIYIWGAQITKGDIKSYLKTTDRLDIPRIDYTNGEPSILLEPQSTNLVTYSEDFSQWIAGGDTSIQSGFLAPNGTNTAYKVSGTSGALTLSGIANQTRTRTIWAKTVSGNGQANLCSYKDNTNNLFTITNQWQRFEVNGTTTATGSTSFYAVDFRGGTTLTEILIWGAQLEDLLYATSYIPTSGSAVTRSADAANNAGNSDLFNDSEGVLYAEIKALANDGTSRHFSINDGTAANKVEIYYDSTTNEINGHINVSGASSALFSQTFATVLEYHKVAVKYKANDFSMFVDGRQIATDTSGVVFPANTLNNLAFDKGNATLDFYADVKSVMVFKEALTDLELEKLTGYNNHELYMNYYNRLSYLGLVEEYNVESDINNYIL